MFPFFCLTSLGPSMLLQMSVFHFFYGWIIPLYIYIIILNQSSVEGHLDYFHVFAIVNSTAMNTGVHVSFWIRGVFFFFFGCIPRSGIAYGSSIFRFLRNLYIVFYVGCANFHYHQQCKRFLFFSSKWGLIFKTKWQLHYCPNI